MTGEEQIEGYDQSACEVLGWKSLFDTGELPVGGRTRTSSLVGVRCLQLAIGHGLTSNVWGGRSSL